MIDFSSLRSRIANARKFLIVLHDITPEFAIYSDIEAQLNAIDDLAINEHTPLSEVSENFTIGLLAVREIENIPFPEARLLADELSEIQYFLDQN